MNNMLSLEEVKSFLEVQQPQIEKYLKEGKLHAYKIGGTYIRFRKEEVLNLRYELPRPRDKKAASNRSVFSRIFDFWRFNNFYLISLAVVGGLLFLLFKH